MKIITNLKLALIAFFSLAMAASLSAQDPTPFYSEDFSSQAEFNAEWTNGGTNTGPEEWKWSDDPGARLFGSQPPFNSTTAENGFIIFDSDANGENQHDVTITSPSIDCSGQDQVFIRFQNQYAYFSAPPTSVADVGVSTDGENFTYYTVLDDVPVNELSADVQVEIVELPEAANQAEVYIQFRWRGFFEYTWRIDDIELFNQNPTPANDMRVNNFYAIAPNFLTPASQVEPFGFIADIQNVGGETQQNIELDITIQDEGGTEVFADQLIYGEVGPDSLAENVFFENEFTPEATPGKSYTGTYSLTIPGVEDANPGNNSQSFSFGISDTLFAKEDGTEPLATSPFDDNSFSFGTVFYVPNSEGLFARYISFGIANAAEVAGETVNIFLYEWGGDANEDFMANPEEYGDGPVTFDFYTITGEEQGLITRPLLDLDGNFVALKDGMYYMAVIQYATEDDTDLRILSSGAQDYGAMNFYSDSTGVEQYALALDVSNTGDYSMIGFGFDVIPVVRMSIGTDVMIGTREAALPASSLKVFPNPVSGQFSADVELEKPADQIEMVLIDRSGRIVQRQQQENQQRHRAQFNVERLPGGAYFLQLRTEEGIRTKKVTIQR